MTTGPQPPQSLRWRCLGRGLSNTARVLGRGLVWAVLVLGVVLIVTAIGGSLGIRQTASTSSASVPVLGLWLAGMAGLYGALRMIGHLVADLDDDDRGADLAAEDLAEQAALAWALGLPVHGVSLTPVVGGGHLHLGRCRDEDYLAVLVANPSLLSDRMRAGPRWRSEVSSLARRMSVEQAVCSPGDLAPTTSEDLISQAGKTAQEFLESVPGRNRRALCDWLRSTGYVGEARIEDILSRPTWIQDRSPVDSIQAERELEDRDLDEQLLGPLPQRRV